MRIKYHILLVALQLLTVSVLHAQWMFVNGDGTLSPYNNEPQEHSYAIPKESAKDEQILGQEVKRSYHPHHIQKKRRKHRIIITDAHAPKRIYLTFDDGPLNGTQNVISVLNETGVDATMFMIGRHVDLSRYRKRLFLRAIDAPNILVANHTYSHANGHYRDFYAHKQCVIRDIEKMERKLRRYDEAHVQKCCRLAGRNVFRLPRIVRNDPAIRSSREAHVYDALDRRGFDIFGWDYQWDYDPHTGKLYKSPRQIADAIEQIYRRHKTHKRGKCILLMHDFTFKDRFNGKAKLRRLIALLQQRGWRFETLESY